MSKISKAQEKALLDVYVKGNFGVDVRFVTKVAVCGRGWVQAGLHHPLALTQAGRAVLRKVL